MAHDTVYYYSSHTVRSEAVITDASRNVVEWTNYAPYGQVLNRALRDGPGYTGHEEDPESSLVYVEQRYYDPEPKPSDSPAAAPPTDKGSSSGNTNPYAAPVDTPVVVVDKNGNAIPVKQGEEVKSS